MTKVLKFLAIVLCSIITVCGFSFLTDKTYYKKWSISKLKSDTAQISWAKFVWTNDTLSGKYYTRTSMQIPCKIEGLPYNFSFQFDLGAYTGIYENTASSLNEKYPEWKNRPVRLRSPFQFWFNKKAFADLTLLFGNYRAKNKLSKFYENYGAKLESVNQFSKDTIHLGTIGADLFQEKILIIDYPNQQFAICENLPQNYKDNLIDIELDISGKVILPMKMKNKNYRITFDNGSSIFPLITMVKNISNFSTSADIDTIQISSWGQFHVVTGKLIKDTFELAGQKFSNVKVYANHSGLGIDPNTDGVTGNALFWNKTIVIDFKNKKFGVQ